MWHRNLRLLLRGMGLVMLVGAAGCLFLGPYEMTCFYLFSEGGRFHYDGFGFGTLMFANISAQVAGYYLLGALGFVLGIGHLRLRAWARRLTIAVLWTWLALGLVLMPVVLWMLVTAKELEPTAAYVLVPLVLLLYPLGPALAIWWYRSGAMTRAFEEGDLQRQRSQDRAVPVLVVGMLLGFLTLVLHALLLLNGAYPAFGVLLTGQVGMGAVGATIVLFALLTWGVLEVKRWAWWGAVGALSMLTSSAMVTLLRLPLAALCEQMRFAPLEMDIVAGMPPTVQDSPLAALAVWPLLVTLVLLLGSRRFYGPVWGGDLG